MKIGFDAKRLFCNYTGLGNYSRTLLGNMARFHPEHEYFLYTTDRRVNPSTLPFLAEPFKVVTTNQPIKPLWRSLLINSRLKRDEIAVYLGLSNELPFGLSRTGIRSVVTVHDLIFRIYPGTYRYIDRRIYDIKFRSACENADKIIAISESTRRDICSHYGTDPSKIEVIYQACHPDYYLAPEVERSEGFPAELNIPSEYLLYVGSVEPRKNLKNILLSYRRLPNSLQIPLVVVGKGGTYLHEAKELARMEGIERKIRWIDGLTDIRQIRALYLNAQALVYPSYYEGFGLPVAEALLCRTPVITSCLSSLPEAGGPSSLYVHPESTDEIAQAIELVLTDSALRGSMAEKGYRYARETFAPERLTSQVIHLLELSTL